MALTLALKLTADGSDLVQNVRASSAELAKLGAAANDAGREARATAAGLGQVETAARQAAASSRIFGQALTGLGASAADIDAALNIRSDFGGAARAADVREFGAELDRVRASINPFVAAQAQMRARQDEINAALKVGAIGHIEAARAHDLNTASYRRQLGALRATTAATRTQTGAVRLQGFQVANLFQQLQDVGVQLSTGFNPFIILAQQGPQITSAMGGVRNSLALVKPFFTATTVSVGLLTAALAVGAAAWSSYLTSIKAVEAAAAGLGRGFGGTAGDLEDIAQAAAEAGGLSVKAAREAEIAFLNTGKIGAEVIGGLVALTKDFAATTGQDFSAAADDLAKAFAEPGKGASDLNDKLRFLDGTTAGLIRTLVEQNRVTEAQGVLLDALKPRLVDHRQSLTLIGRAWENVGTKASDAFDRLGEGVDRLFTVRPASEQFLDELVQARERARASFGGRALLEGVGIVDEAALDREIARVRAGINQAAQDKVARDANVTQTRGDATARSLTPGLIELEALRKKQADLRDELNNPVANAASESFERLADAYGAASRAVRTFITPAERARASSELDIAALTAKTPALKGAIAEERKRLDLQGQVISADEAAAQVTAAGNFARAQATQAIVDEASALKLNTTATLEVAAAMLTSASAAQVAEARRQALTDSIKDGGDVEARTRANLAAAVASQIDDGARAVVEIGAEANAREALNATIAAGTLTLAEANQRQQLDLTLRPLVIARDNAEGEAKLLLTRIIDALTAAQGRLFTAQSRGAALDTLARQQDDLDALRLEIELIGASADERERRLALFRAEQEIERTPNISDSDAQAIRDNATAEAALNLQLERQSGLYDDLARVGGQALDGLTDAVAANELSWQSLADVAVSALQDIERQLLRLIVSNPLQNLIFGGTQLPTIADVGGLFGSVFHEGGIVGAGSNDNRFVPARVVAQAPRFHRGGLVSGERVIIAEDDEEVLTADNPRHISNIRRAAGGSPSLRFGAAGSGNAFGDGSAAPVPVVNFTIHEAPGTRADVSQRTEANGSLSFDVVVRQIEDAIGGNVASGKGAVFAGVAKRFGLNAAAGLGRSR